MKKWGFLLLLLLCLCLTFINIEPFFEPKEEIQAYEQYENANVVDRRISESLQKLEITEEQIYQGNLLLVNSEYLVHPKGIKSDVINLFTHNEWTKGYGLLDSEMYLSENIARRFSEMISAAKKEGFIISQLVVAFETLMSKLKIIKKWVLTMHYQLVIANTIWDYRLM